MLDTAIIVLLILLSDWQIGLICLTGTVLFSLVNHRIRVQMLRCPGKSNCGYRLVANVRVYQGIPR